MRDYNEYFQSLLDANRENKVAAERYRELSMPQMHDMNKMPELYELFQELSPGTGPEDKRRFVFVVLYFFQPGALVSGKMKKGLRKALSKTLGCHPVRVSQMSSNLLFYFQHYRQYRDDIVSLLSKIENLLYNNNQ